MNGRTTLNLKCLTVAAAVALLATLPVQAGAAASPHRSVRAPLTSGLRSTTGAQPNPVRPTGSGTSYFWADASIAAALVTGLLVLGLWGDRAVGGGILGIQLLCASAARGARKVRAHAFARYCGRTAPNTGRARLGYSSRRSSPTGRLP
jgi:hypothetical protein